MSLTGIVLAVSVNGLSHWNEELYGQDRAVRHHLHQEQEPFHQVMSRIPLARM